MGDTRQSWKGAEIFTLKLFSMIYTANPL